ncbi:hypothetical protein [Speluncibacter jeojiensis]|uniref:Uncharacterized protein n=1 Tax=Speluncibacter jeojiensis TaxID=2710754 RepID=A0A9X4LYE9_9ACTN|nr:hypothetical protein [Corynebacteriales bacterium D3-21]
MTSPNETIDRESWEFVQQVVQAAHTSDVELFAAEFQKLDDMELGDQVLPYLVYLVSQQLWHLSPEQLTSEKIRELAESIHPGFSEFLKVEPDDIYNLLLSVFGKSEFGKNLGSARFAGYLAISLGLISDNVSSDLDRMRPGLIQWCQKNGFVKNQ